MTRQMTSQGMRALIVREGSRNKMYHDAAGLPTIGVGHLLTRSELTSGKIIITGKPVHWRAGLSDKHITALLDQDNDIAEQAVNDLVRVPLTDNQFDALVSFVFNVASVHLSARRCCANSTKATIKAYHISLDVGYTPRANPSSKLGARARRCNG